VWQHGNLNGLVYPVLYPYTEERGFTLFEGVFALFDLKIFQQKEYSGVANIYFCVKNNIKKFST
jgi:hypothetical protein